MNTNKVKFSIITPVYNSFNLMANYFKSLEQQKYKNFEVIIIDDCSTDNSYNQLIKYKQNSKLNIKILKTKTNSGPGNARNIGMSAAEGEWFTFIDNDDWVVSNFLEIINKTINDHELDCLIYDYYRKHESGKEIRSKSAFDLKEGYILPAEGIKNVTNHTWGKFYKLELCKNNNIIFPNLRKCEDVAFTGLIISLCKKIYYLESPLYYYFQRENSLSNNTKLDERDMVKAFSILQKNLEKKYPQEIKEKSIRDLLYGCVLMMCKSKKSSNEIKLYINSYEKIYPDWFLCNMVHKIGKAKYVFLICIKYRLMNSLKILSYIHNKLIKS